MSSTTVIVSSDGMVLFMLCNAVSVVAFINELCIDVWNVVSDIWKFVLP